jgi:hypothetical protein
MDPVFCATKISKMIQDHQPDDERPPRRREPRDR